MESTVYKIQYRLDQLEATEQVDKLLPKVTSHQRAHEALIKRRESLTNLSKLKTSAVLTSAELDKTVSRIKVLEQEFKKLAPETCPLCDSPMGGG